MKILSIFVAAGLAALPSTVLGVDMPSQGPGVVKSSSRLTPSSADATNNLPRPTDAITAKALAMMKLERETFGLAAMSSTEDSGTSMVDRYNVWPLLVCSMACNNIHGNDQATLEGHPSIAGTPALELTFEMCTRGYRGCNSQCLEEFNDHMKHWTDKGHLVFTSWELPMCIDICNGEAATDTSFLKSRPDIMDSHHPDLSIINFAMVNKKLHRCSNACVNATNRAMAEWEELHFP
ncbi:hypothetical protein EKO04_008411 [Ascochyta lentis]|uniref:Uncharacterized protein n=1 Tax=Ascochyta lentis TaxID=205686 RepID=A0A8H7IVX3_9PLEO|nr:hypothetical protein EKO04_008411 [Ascochyta lentis]